MPILFTHCTLSCLFFLASFKIIMSIFSSISKFYAIFNDPLQKFILFSWSFSKKLCHFFWSISNFWSKFLINFNFYAHFFQSFHMFIPLLRSFNFYSIFFPNLFFLVFFRSIFFIFLLPMFFPCDWVSILPTNLRANQVEPEQSRLNLKEIGENMNWPRVTVRMDSGWMRVARGVSGSKAPPLAACPLILRSYQRYITAQKHSTYHLRLELDKLTDWLASLDSSPIQVASSATE